MFDNRRIIFILAFFLFRAFVLTAQVQNDSANIKVPLRIFSFSESCFNYGNSSVRDSITYKLDSFQIVHPFLLSTGNLGAPARTLFFQSPEAEPFSVRRDAFGYFGFNRYNRKFYSTNQPYTLLQYFVGQRREQYVNVVHSRSFGENLNFSFHFIRARSEGFYKRQNTSNTSVRSNIWYKSPGKKYALMADVFWTGANVAENGGLENDSSFEFSNQIDRQVVAVNLENAGTIQRKRGVWTKHTFGFGKTTDTLMLDSARVYNVITPAWGISLVSELSDEKYNYNDGFPQSGFYDVVYRDTLQTSDSTYCWRVNNSIRLERFNQYGLKMIKAFVGARHEGGEYFNDTIYTNFTNIYAEGALEYTFDTVGQANNTSFRRTMKNTLDVSGWYVVSGTNSGDYLLDLNGTIALAGNSMLLSVKGETRGLSPAMIYRNYSGNHLRWQNSFTQTKRSSTEITFSFVRYRNLLLEASAKLITEVDPLYFDETFLPAQYHGDINNSSVGLLASWKWGWFNSASRVTFNSTSNDSIFRYPEWVVQHTMFANMMLFKNAMQLQVGVDVTWFSEFTAEAYMPAVAQFYLQNQRAVGNYVYIDPWVSFRIKPVRVFVKAEHVNAGLMGRKYFLLDGYPHNDFALKIGISWLFSD